MLGGSGYPEVTSASRRTVAALLASMLLTAFAVGWVWEVARTNRDNASVAFNQAMTNHHAQAVAISMILHERVSDPDLLAVARDIVLTQQAQIGAMGSHLDAIGANRAGSGHVMKGMASPADIASLSTLSDAAAARLGISLLIAHHRGGVEMAEHYLQEGLDRPSARLAERIVAGQSSEIELLRQLADRFEPDTSSGS